MEFIRTAVIAFIGVGIGNFVGHAFEEGKLQRAAIERGHAEWRVVDSSGKTEFHWTTNPASAEK
jgi:hypothetical protein